MTNVSPEDLVEYEPNEAPDVEEYQVADAIPLEANPADVIDQLSVVEFDEPEP